MLDLLAPSVSQRLFVVGQGDTGVNLDLEVEDMVAEALGLAERREEESGAERFCGREELVGEVSLCLEVVDCQSSYPMSHHSRVSRETYNIHLALPGLLHGEGESSF